MSRTLSLPILLPLLLGAAPGLDAPSKGDGIGHAKRMLGTGRPRLAAAAFREVLAERPDDPEARAGLGRALAGFGDCSEALSYLQGVRGTPAWTTVTILAAAGCEAQRGQLARAEADYAEVVRLQPHVAVPLYQRAMVQVQQLDAPGVRATLAELEGLFDQRAMGRIVRAWAALEWGQPDFDDHLWELETYAGRFGYDDALIQARVLDAQRWLDLGDPARALEVVVAGRLRFPHHVALATLGAEARRRLGATGDAAYTIERRHIQRTDALPMVAVRARIRVDQGDLRAARELLEPLAGVDHPEVLASRWYLARAEGDSATQAELAEAWQVRVLAADRELADLLLPAEADATPR